ALHERCSITQPLSAGYPEEADRMISPFTTIPLDNHQIKNPFQMFAGKVTSAERQYIVEVLYCEESGIIHIKLNDR
ncbi:MAG: hypothetical protein KDA65_09965, partial [Planctomycetaceae bacterium]|nr:hypothetical protein [Planctomycetaceae bacterium]